MEPHLIIDKDQIKNELTLENIKNILLDLGGGEPKEDREGNLIFITCCHGGSKHKLYYYKDSKMFRCYTDCSESFDIYELVIRSKHQQGYNYNFFDAIRYISELTGLNLVYDRSRRYRFGEDNYKIDDWQWLNRFKRKEKIKIDLPVYDEKVLNVFLPYAYEPWEEEGISLKTQRDFGIRYYVKNDSVIIPHYDINNNLIGIRQRNTRQEELKEGRKYTPVIVEGKQYNHPLGMNLYGLNITKKTIRKIKKILLFEGEKSCMKASDLYGDMNFTVAVCSNNITNFQRDIILSLNVEEVFIAFDKYGEDDDEEKILMYKERLLKFAKMFTPYCKTYIIWDDEGLLDFKDSPIDKGKKVLEKLMKNKYEIGTVG
mgnify:CR=1 FL=1